MSDEIYLSRQGHNKMIEELQRLIQRKPHIQEEIARAREHGDLKENAEYHAAKESLTNLGKRIAELENKLGRARIIEEQKIDKDKVYIGATVQLKDNESGEEYEYCIVDVEEANLSKGKISIQSPFAQGLLGHKEGETVSLNLPQSTIKVKILKIF